MFSRDGFQLKFQNGGGDFGSGGSAEIELFLGSRVTFGTFPPDLNSWLNTHIGNFLDFHTTVSTAILELWPKLQYLSKTAYEELRKMQYSKLQETTSGSFLFYGQFDFI